MKFLILSFILWILFLKITLFHLEKFSDSPPLYYRVSLNSSQLWIYYQPQWVNQWMINPEIAGIKNVQFIQSPPGYRDCLHLIDTYTYAREDNNNGSKLLLVIPDTVSLLLIKPRGKIIDLKLIDVVDQIIIGYTSQTEKELIEIIGLSMKIKREELNLKFVTVTSVSDQSFVDLGIDVLCLLINLKSIETVLNLDPKFKVDFVNYDNIDINLLKYYFPPAQLTNISLDIYWKSYQVTFPIKKILNIDLLLVGDNKIESNPRLKDPIFQLLVFADNFDVINLYSMWFPIFSQTQFFLNTQNSHRKDRDKMTILEQFDVEKYFEFSPKYNLEGYFDSIDKTLKIKSKVVEDVPLQRGWKIILVNQTRPEENGEYFFNGTLLLYQILILDPKFTYSQTDNILVLDHPIHQIDGIPWEKITENNPISIPALNSIGYRKNNTIVIPNLKENEDGDRWNCTDPTIKLRGLCQSKYDI